MADSTKTALSPAPPDTPPTTEAPATTQDWKRVFTTLRADVPNTATPPPRTDVKGEYLPAPLAEQFQKVVDDNRTEVLPTGTSNDTAPPLLFEAVPTAPIATVTEQLLNSDECRLTLESATLMAYTAPPPPLAVPGGTDAELVTAQHKEKLEFRISNEKLNPVKIGAVGTTKLSPQDASTPDRKRDTCGACSTATAPPYTDDEPAADPSENETAEQFENEVPEKAMRES